jgi:hypothetical protein
MNARLKNLIGTILFVAGSGVYFVFVISVAVVRLPDTPMTTQLLFYLVTTLIWLFFAGWLIWWMAKARRP